MRYETEADFVKKITGATRKKITVIIPAAGKGTRLRYHKPKILYPLLGKPVLEYLYQLLTEFSERIIIVVDKNNGPVVKKYLDKHAINAEVVTIKNSLGTADSILSARKYCKKREDILVIWGDQVGIKKESLEKIISLHYQKNAHFSLPTILKKQPYIHFRRNEEGMITNILRKRFKHKMPEYGENDAGVFLAKGDLLFSTLHKMKLNYLKKRRCENNIAGEFDFLDIIPKLAKENYKIITAFCVTAEETIGLNDMKEVKFHENRFLKKYE